MPINVDYTGLPKLPREAMDLVDILYSGKTLGASRNMRQINEIFMTIARTWKGTSAKELVETVRGTGNYIAKTRGKNTPSIGNAINKVLFGLEELAGGDVKDVLSFIKARGEDFNKTSISNVDKIATYGANLLAESKCILAFDYSSSMTAIIKKLGENGQKKHFVIPESRDLDGGRPIVKETIPYGHTVDFIIDMAVFHFIKQVDAVIIGAETVFADGSCWNTVGSYLIALLAQANHVPYFVATELIKIDPRSFGGYIKPLVSEDYSRVLDYPSDFEKTELINVHAPVFDRVPPAMIDSYITEQGVMPPYQIWRQSKEFLSDFGIDPLA